MTKYVSIILLTLLFLIPKSEVTAQVEGLPPGVQYNCLKMDWCVNSGTCSVNHVHRARLSTEGGHTGTPSRTEAYVTECIEYIPAGQNTPKTVCTTGDSALDQELFCGDSSCDFFTELKNAIGYTISQDDSYGVYQYNSITNTYQKTGPAKVATDAQGKMIPAALEWQSYTPQAHERKFLIWGRISSSTEAIASTDAGQKQATLTWPSLSEICTGEVWDPEGIVYDAETGIPIDNVNLNIGYSTTKSGIFETAKAGIGEILPPGTLPLLSRLAGFYMFYGKPGYYTIEPQIATYAHMKANQISIPADIAALYRPNLNYFADSEPILEVAGQRQVKNIPMILEPGQARPPFTFQVTSHTTNATSDGKIVMEGRVNASATLIVEKCASMAGIPNCRDKKEYKPGNGGPSPSTYFRYSISLDQKDLKAGETYSITFEPVLTVKPQASVSMIESILGFLSKFVPTVSAQESQSIRMNVEPIPTYVEGFAYDAKGLTIPNAIVEVHVSFSPAAVYTTRADANGYFKITSNNLPKDPYTLTFTNASGNVTKLNTSQFLAQNNEFMVVEKVNPYVNVTELTNPRANVTPQFQPRSAETVTLVQQNDVAANQEIPQETEPTETVTTQTPSNFVVLAMIVGALVVVAGAVGIYIMKRRSAEPMNMG